MKVNGKDDIPYIMENKKMFQTSNQYNIFWDIMLGGFPNCFDMFWSNIW